MFQHTAARRRLLMINKMHALMRGFNTQPPEGGCYDPQYEWGYELVSTHSRPKAAAP